MNEDRKMVKRVKLIDFGFATKVQEHGLVSGAKGTKSYMAPEILENDNEEYNGKLSDIYSLGKCLQMLLAPEKDLNDLNSLVSNEAWDLLVGMISDEPCLRVSIDEILCHDWFKNTMKFEDLE